MIKENSLQDTFFDLPQRSTHPEIHNQVKKFSENKLIQQLLEGYPEFVVILDKNRHIVAHNSNSEHILIPDESGEINGQRLGEALKCIHAFEMPAGCGTTQFCSECGAGKANKFTRETKKTCIEECRVTVKNNGYECSLDLNIHTSILTVNDDEFILFSIKDIADKKRKQVFERIFFHDVLNTASSINSISEILNEYNNFGEVENFVNMLSVSSDQLLRELESQRDLVHAENGELNIVPEVVRVSTIMQRAYNMYRNHHLAQKKNYTVEIPDKDIGIETSPIHLIRSLGNLIKNALEAVKNNENVKLTARLKDNKIYFDVSNSGVIPENIQLQIFQRSFSTKSKSGRGIGTYSVKFLIGQYLNGKVYFVSNENVNTIFTIELPVTFNQYDLT